MSEDAAHTTSFEFTLSGEPRPDCILRVPASDKASHEDIYCHAVILSLASPCFKEALCGQWKETTNPLRIQATGQQANSSDATEMPSASDTRGPVDGLRGTILLEGEDKSIVLQALKAVYPRMQPAVTWDNCSALLSFADKWELLNLLRSCRCFVEQHFLSRPILSMALAEKYNWASVLETASRSVLLQWPSQDDPDKNALTMRAASALHSAHTTALSRLLLTISKEGKWLSRSPRYPYGAFGRCAFAYATTFTDLLSEVMKDPFWTFDGLLKKVRALDGISNKVGKLNCKHFRGCKTYAECFAYWKFATVTELELILGVRNEQKFAGDLRVQLSEVKVALKHQST